MPEMRVQLLKGDRTSDDVQYRSYLPTNMYAVVNPVHGAGGFLSAHPGFNQIAEAPGRDRNGIFNERLGQHLRVSGDKFVWLRSDGELIELGDLPGSGTQTSHAALPYSFNTQAIITGGRMWLWDGGELKEVTDTDLGSPIDGCFIDGYYFLTDGEFLFHTELDDEFEVEPEKFATSEFSPDRTVGVAKTQDNQVMVFNRYTTEFFFNAANEGFAFERIAGKAVKAGIIATHGKVEMNGEFFCLGSAKEEAPTMLVIGAGRAINFSTREIDNLLSTYTEGELRRTIMFTRTDDRDQLIYVHLLRHTLLYNHSITETVGKDYAWSILKSGIVGDEPWLPINIIYDRDQNQWIGGIRTDGPSAPDPYSASAYYNALREIDADGIWILDDAAGSSVASDSSDFGRDLSIFGTRNYEQPSFLDDGRSSMFFGDDPDGYVIRGGGDIVTDRNFAVGFISTVTGTTDRRVVVKLSNTADSGVAVYADTAGIRVEIRTDGDVLSHQNTISTAVADGDVIMLDMSLDAAGVFAYEVYKNFSLAGSAVGDLATSVALDSDSHLEAMFTGSGRMQYLWFKNGGVTTEQVSTLTAGLANNDESSSIRPVSGLIALDDTSGSQDGGEVEYILTSPFMRIESASIDEIELDAIPGVTPSEVKAFISLTYDGRTFSREWTMTYSAGMGDNTRRFIARRLGYVRHWVGFRLRLVTPDKIAFANLVVRYG